MNTKPNAAGRERRQAQTREEQIEIVKRHLSRVFARRFKNVPEAEFEGGRECAEHCYVANRMRKYIRLEDNSVRGFTRRFQRFNSAAHREAFIATRLSQMKELPTPLPPQFVGLTNYESDQRFLEINYQGTKATINDGTFRSTFPYYEAYSPLVDHLAIAIHLKLENAFLGADDGNATHSLLLDRAQNKIYIATRRQTQHFMAIQIPNTPEERARAAKRMSEFINEFGKPKNLKDLQKSGMFQFLGRVADRSAEVEQMRRFLNKYIPEPALKFLKQF